MTDGEIRALAQRVLCHALGRAGFDEAAVEARPNHADEDSIFVTARFRPGAGVTRGGLTADALVALRKALEDGGEHRFPYLIYEYPDDPPPYADDARAAE